LDYITTADSPLDVGDFVVISMGRHDELARVEQVQQALYGWELREHAVQQELDGIRYRWVRVEHIWDSRENIMVFGKMSPVAARTEAEVREAFGTFAERELLHRTTPTRRSYSPQDVVEQKARWRALADMHPQAIKMLVPPTGAEICAEELVTRRAKASKEFAIDMFSIWRIVLRPLDGLSRRKLKDFGRRRWKLDWIQRYLARNWYKKHLGSLNEIGLLQHLKADGPEIGANLTPEALRKRANRLELFCDHEGGLVKK